MKEQFERATFGGGCFWQTEEDFREVPGVKETSVGFMGGKVENPSYEQVCTEDTGHTEVVHIIFDPEKITYQKLLKRFFDVHDPTQVNRQGPDIGFQYRSVIFYHDDAQRKAAEEYIAELKKTKNIMTALEPASAFYGADEYHQKYLYKRGLKTCQI